MPPSQGCRYGRDFEEDANPNPPLGYSQPRAAKGIRYLQQCMNEVPKTVQSSKSKLKQLSSVRSKLAQKQLTTEAPNSESKQVSTACPLPASDELPTSRSLPVKKQQIKTKSLAASEKVTMDRPNQDSKQDSTACPLPASDELPTSRSLPVTKKNTKTKPLAASDKVIIDRPNQDSKQDSTACPLPASDELPTSRSVPVTKKHTKTKPLTASDKVTMERPNQNSKQDSTACPRPASDDLPTSRSLPETKQHPKTKSLAASEKVPMDNPKPDSKQDSTLCPLPASDELPTSRSLSEKKEHPKTESLAVPEKVPMDRPNQGLKQDSTPCPFPASDELPTIRSLPETKQHPKTKSLAASEKVPMDNPKPDSKQDSTLCPLPASDELPTSRSLSEKKEHPKTESLAVPEKVPMGRPNQGLKQVSTPCALPTSDELPTSRSLPETKQYPKTKSPAASEKVPMDRPNQALKQYSTPCPLSASDELPTTRSLPETKQHRKTKSLAASEQIPMDRPNQASMQDLTPYPLPETEQLPRARSLASSQQLLMTRTIPVGEWRLTARPNPTPKQFLTVWPIPAPTQLPRGRSFPVQERIPTTRSLASSQQLLMNGLIPAPDRHPTSRPNRASKHLSTAWPLPAPIQLPAARSLPVLEQLPRTRSFAASNQPSMTSLIPSPERRSTTRSNPAPKKFSTFFPSPVPEQYSRTRSLAQTLTKRSGSKRNDVRKDDNSNDAYITRRECGSNSDQEDHKSETKSVKNAPTNSDRRTYASLLKDKENEINIDPLANGLVDDKCPIRDSPTTSNGSKDAHAIEEESGQSLHIENCRPQNENENKNAEVNINYLTSLDDEEQLEINIAQIKECLLKWIDSDVDDMKPRKHGTNVEERGTVDWPPLETGFPIKCSYSYWPPSYLEPSTPYNPDESSEHKRRLQKPIGSERRSWKNAKNELIPNREYSSQEVSKNSKDQGQKKSKEEWPTLCATVQDDDGSLSHTLSFSGSKNLDKEDASKPCLQETMRSKSKYKERMLFSEILKPHKSRKEMEIEKNIEIDDKKTEEDENKTQPEKNKIQAGEKKGKAEEKKIKAKEKKIQAEEKISQAEKGSKYSSIAHLHTFDVELDDEELKDKKEGPTLDNATPSEAQKSDPNDDDSPWIVQRSKKWKRKAFKYIGKFSSIDLPSHCTTKQTDSNCKKKLQNSAAPADDMIQSSREKSLHEMYTTELEEDVEEYVEIKTSVFKSTCKSPDWWSAAENEKKSDATENRETKQEEHSSDKQNVWSSITYNNSYGPDHAKKHPHRREQSKEGETLSEEFYALLSKIEITQFPEQEEMCKRTFSDLFTSTTTKDGKMKVSQENFAMTEAEESELNVQADTMRQAVAYYNELTVHEQQYGNMRAIWESSNPMLDVPNLQENNAVSDWGEQGAIFELNPDMLPSSSETRGEMIQSIFDYYNLFPDVKLCDYSGFAPLSRSSDEWYWNDFALEIQLNEMRRINSQVKK